MITLTKNGNAVKFQFEDSQHYLIGDGEIEVPVNSLSLIIDESEMVTFKKASSDDIFVSFNPADSNLSTKDGVIDFYKNNMVGATGGGGSGSGVTIGEVQSMIDASLEDYPTIDDVNETLEDYYTKDEVDAGFSSVTQDIAAATSGLAQSSAVTALNSSLTAHTANTDIHTTSAEKSVWNGKQDALTAGSGISINNNVISVTASTGGSNVVELTQAQYEALVDKDPDVLYVITDAPEINISGKADTSAVTAVNDALTAHTANTTVHTTSAEKTTWNGKQNALTAGNGIDITNDVISVTGGTDTGTVQTMIEDYCDPKEEVIATALNDLNDRVEDLESGGSSVTIATAITSSSTNDEAAGALATYNAITAATTGGGVTVDTALDTGSTNPVANSAITAALDAKADKSTAARGISVVTTNNKERIFLSNQNGTEITGSYYQIHCSRINNKQILDRYAQNLNVFQLVETSAITSAMTSSSTDAQVPSAKAVYDTLGGLKFVKLTQSEYDQLATKDANTLYIITNVVS